MSKRGRLRSVTIKHHYKDGHLAGHTVRAEHEPDEDDRNPSASPIYTSDALADETSHETHDGALAMARQHHEDNVKRFGAGKKRKSVMDAEAMRAAIGRKA